MLCCWNEVGDKEHSPATIMKRSDRNKITSKFPDFNPLKVVQMKV